MSAENGADTVPEGQATRNIAALGVGAARTQAAAVPTTQRQSVSTAVPDAQVAAGTVYGGGPREDPVSDLPADAVPLPKLTIGSHLASPETLRRMQVGTAPVGLVLGHDRDRQLVSVRLFRPEPTRITLVGGLWAAQLTVLRALAMGVRVVVFSRQPNQWQGFGEWATGRSDRLAVMAEERPVTVQSTPHSPTLLLYDVGPLGPSVRPQLGPWQTQFTFLRQLTAFGFPAVQESGLVMFQRLSLDEAAAAASILRLTPQTAQLLQALRDDMLALLGGQADRYVWIRPTAVEQERLGGPHR